VTRFRKWRHPLAAPRTWTPLFFLDDAVALAAGHRPCGLCRRDSYKSYQAAVAAAGDEAQPVGAVELNRRLALERLRRGRGLERSGDRRLWRSGLDELPDGTVVISEGEPALVTADHVQTFGFSGWGHRGGAL